MASAERQLTRKARIAAASAALVALLDKPVRVIPTCGGISKSKFVAGLQCAKRLFLQVHQPHLAKLTDQANKDQGTAVGVLARSLFRGGALVDVDRNHLADAVLEHSPTLSALFLQGKRAVNPFKTLQVAEQDKDFEGKKHPTYFKFQDKEYGREIRRDCHINQRCRMVFETDAVNDYFSRSVDPGEFSLFLVSEVGRSPVSDYVGPNLQNGIATLTVQLPANCQIGDLLRFQAVVTDPTKLDPFENTFSLDVKPEAVAHGGGGGERHKPPTKEKGEEREVPTGINLPNIVPIYEADWPSQTPAFDKYTALRIGITDVPSNGEAENANGESHDVYDFKINMDNLFLKSELKSGGDEIEMIRARWKYGLVLIGLALLHDENQAKKARAQAEDANQEEENGDSIETLVERFTRAIAPVLLPMISSLGALELEEALGVVASGEAT